MRKLFVLAFLLGAATGAVQAQSWDVLTYDEPAKEYQRTFMTPETAKRGMAAAPEGELIRGAQPYLSSQVRVRELRRKNRQLRQKPEGLYGICLRRDRENRELVVTVESEPGLPLAMELVKRRKRAIRNIPLSAGTPFRLDLDQLDYGRYRLHFYYGDQRLRVRTFRLKKFLKPQRF